MSVCPEHGSRFQSRVKVPDSVPLGTKGTAAEDSWMVKELNQALRLASGPHLVATMRNSLTKCSKGRRAAVEPGKLGQLGL